MSKEEKKAQYQSSPADDIELQQRNPREPLNMEAPKKPEPSQENIEGSDEDLDLQEEEEKRKKKEEDELPKVSFFELLRFATKTDVLLMILGSAAAIINGIALPMFALIFGQMTDSFSPTSTGDDIVDAAGTQALYFLYIGLGSFALSWI